MGDEVDLDLLFGDKQAWIEELRKIRQELAVGSKAYVGAIRRLQALEATLGIPGRISGPRSGEILEATAIMASRLNIEGQEISGSSKEETRGTLGGEVQERASLEPTGPCERAPLDPTGPCESEESGIGEGGREESGVGEGGQERAYLEPRGPCEGSERGGGVVGQGTEDLEEGELEAAGGCSQECAARVPLKILIGDSIARDSPIARGPNMLSLARGGHSFSRQGCYLAEVERAIDPNRDLHTIYIWLGGNDMYTGRGNGVLPTVAEMFIRCCADLATVVIIGPTPRIAFDEGKAWEVTPAYRAEVRLADIADGGRIKMIRPGRTLTTHIRGTRVVVNRAYWARDGVHLSSLGHARVWEFIASRMTK